MKRRLTAKEYIILASMLFGMFFGAGNLVFPVSMGQQAGANLWPAIAGFCLTGVGIPLLGIAAMGISRSEGLFDMCLRIGRPYAYFFTMLLYLSIGPLFAIPRTATVSFSVGIQPVIHAGNVSLALCVFSALFFAAVLFFSLRPSGIMTWIGKMLNPLFLAFLAVLAVTALMNPMSPISSAVPTGKYVEMSFFQGFLEGYNTLDAVASLVFGIILVNSVRSLGIHDPKAISASTLLSGILSTLLMAAIYCILTVLGAQSQSVVGISSDGGAALYEIGSHYFGTFGGVLLGLIVTFACLKTAIGLITSCATAFVEIFPNSLSYRAYAILFCLFSFGIANFGLSRIIELSLPALMFLYPLTITLILLCLFGHLFDYDRRVFVCVTVFTFVPALFDFINALPAGTKAILHGDAVIAVAQHLPLFSIGMGWVIPAIVGLALGLGLRAAGKK
ncbi:MAG: branched-chain amino acid transport system II carrier protein [Clostridiales bacterium]|nr:branched-chain amino acid transport system II carrier protein [Clostridiales bacterium]